jgi:cytidylate kinase
MPSPSSVEGILERQARSWEQRRKLSSEGGPAARAALAHLREGPWVTISRQWGSGGLALARELGAALGWQVYDREILGEIARHDPLREAILSRVEKRAFGTFSDYVSHLIAGDPGYTAYLEELMHVVWGLAKQGQAVIVGRGANWFLDAAYGLRVRIVSSLERRVARVAEAEGLPLDVVRTRVLEHDATRRSLVRQIFNRDIDDPLGYDLVLNFDAVDAQTGARIIAAAVHAKLGAAK